MARFFEIDIDRFLDVPLFENGAFFHKTYQTYTEKKDLYHRLGRISIEKEARICLTLHLYDFYIEIFIFL